MDRQAYIEEWRPVSNTFGQYEVSNFGNVRSLKRNKVRIMPITKQHHGYNAFMVHVDNKPQCRKVHREVAIAFIPNPENKSEVNHIDGNKDNNQVSNLEWVTHQRNVKHSFETGIRTPHRFTYEERAAISLKVKTTLASKRASSYLATGQLLPDQGSATTCPDGREQDPEPT